MREIPDGGAILALDTSGGTSVAVVRDGVTLAHASSADPRGHAEHAAALAAHVLDRADLTPADLVAVAVGTGPAPFTGLRVGLVTAQALARSREIPALGAPSLEAWAAGAFLAPSGPASVPAEEVRVITDARRREVYTARYGWGDVPGGIVELEAPRVVTPAELAPLVGRERERGLEVVGPGVHEDVLGPARGTFDVARLALLVLARHRAGLDTPTEPLYLRRPDIHTKAALPAALPAGAAR